MGGKVTPLAVMLLLSFSVFSSPAFSFEHITKAKDSPDLVSLRDYEAKGKTYVDGNGVTTREFTFEIKDVVQEVYPGKKLLFWVFVEEGQEARFPGPTIRVTEGQRVIVHLKNGHYLSHTIHWHGLSLPNKMDGVPGITQPAVQSGQSYTYDFIAKESGSYMYHCHMQSFSHMEMGMYGAFVVEPKDKSVDPHYDSEEILLLDELDENLHGKVEQTPQGRVREMLLSYPTVASEPNIFVINGASFPITAEKDPIVIEDGKVARLRLMNIGFDLRSIHIHGHHFNVTHSDGYKMPYVLQKDTIPVAPGERYDIYLKADQDPGVWMVHDHQIQAVTSNGIYPGGMMTHISYRSVVDEQNHPKHTHVNAAEHFDQHYYRGEKEEGMELGTKASFRGGMKNIFGILKSMFTGDASPSAKRTVE